MELQVRDMNLPSKEKIAEFKLGLQRALERSLAKQKKEESKHVGFVSGVGHSQHGSC